jgi:hypothetical protein
MKLWWLSFAGEEEFLGLALIEAETLEEAFDEARRLGRHPGGQCLGMPVDPNGSDVQGLPRDRLITDAELHERGHRPLREYEAKDRYINKQAIVRMGGGMICEDHAP